MNPTNELPVSILCNIDKRVESSSNFKFHPLFCMPLLPKTIESHLHINSSYPTVFTLESTNKDTFILHVDMVRMGKGMWLKWHGIIN
jgi:hypothetical protein